MINNINSEELAWGKMDGLLPAIVQDVYTGDVLMLGYMNQQALEQTLATNQVTFYSRSKQRLWTKGETSGNGLQLVGIQPDCDNDTLLVQAIPSGPICHLGTNTCFNHPMKTDWGIIQDLQQLIAQRQEQLPEKSYIAALFNSGLHRIAQKVGEEGVETALAAVDGDSNAVCSEAADLLFHLLILLKARDVALTDVVAELKNRAKTKKS